MKKNFESILLSILIGTSVLLGLSFWLNTKFGFNLFCEQHWQELSRLQATNTPVSINFYISIGLAIFIFVFGIYLIYRPKFKKIITQSYDDTNKVPETKTTEKPDNEKQNSVAKAKPSILMTKPSKLNLPNNIREIAEAKYKNQKVFIRPENQDLTKYDSELADIFKKNGYLVKKKLNINDMSSNLLAIGSNESIWLGYTDCDIEKVKNAATRLDNFCDEMLDDIQINIYPFVLDTLGAYDSDETVLVFKSVEDIAKFMSEHQSEIKDEYEQNNLDAFSEFMDAAIVHLNRK